MGGWVAAGNNQLDWMDGWQGMNIDVAPVVCARHTFACNARGLKNKQKVLQFAH